MNDITPLKRCSKCKNEYPATPEYFNRSKKEKGGFRSRCRQCQREDSLIYRQNNHEKEIERHRKFNQTESNRQSQRKYRQSHKPERREYASKWRRNNPEKINEQYKRYYEKNADRKRAYHQQWAKDNLANISEYRRQYRILNPEKIRTQERMYSQTIVSKTARYRRRARIKSLPDTLTNQELSFMYEHWGYRCAVCGRTADSTHVIVADHWLAVASGGGTTLQNMIPLCHAIKGGSNGCNNSKIHKSGLEWLIQKFGYPECMDIYARILQYFDVTMKM